jgi:hypothetical protein
MTAQRTIRLRTRQLLCLAMTFAVLAISAFTAPTAFAQVYPNGPAPTTVPSTAAPVVTSTPATIVHSGSGLAIWLVVVIAIAALAVGMVLAEVARSLVRNRPVRRPVAVAS